MLRENSCQFNTFRTQVPLGFVVLSYSSIFAVTREHWYKGGNCVSPLMHNAAKWSHALLKSCFKSSFYLAPTWKTIKELKGRGPGFQRCNTMCSNMCSVFSEVYLGPYPISMMELFTKIVNDLQTLIICAKSSILDIWSGPKNPIWFVASYL